MRGVCVCRYTRVTAGFLVYNRAGLAAQPGPARDQVCNPAGQVSREELSEQEHEPGDETRR